MSTVLKVVLIGIIFVASSTYSYNISNKQFRQNIVKTAKKQLGVKYSFGGTGKKGFDCSGFTMFVFRQNGMNLPRSSSAQYKLGRKISYRNGKPGDLIFFNINGRGVSHVGIYLGNGKFIHAPSSGKSIKIASLKINYWKKRYVAIARYWEY